MKRIFKLNEAAQECGFSDQILIEFIEHHWIEPSDLEHRAIDEEDLARAKLIHELQTDLGVNDESVPIILHLLDQLNHLHSAMRNLRKTNRSF